MAALLASLVSLVPMESCACLNLIIKGKRRVTPDTALRLSKALGGSVEFWLNLQQDVDLYDAIVNSANTGIARVQRIRAPSTRTKPRAPRIEDTALRTAM